VEQGHAAAQYNLGISYYNGEGVLQDYKEAVKWYRKAAEQGYADAQNNLAVCYFGGMGVLQDYVEAYAWALHAAMNGNSRVKDVLAEELTAEQISAGRQRAREIAREMKQK
jgi:TPR repeat protein